MTTALYRLYMLTESGMQLQTEGVGTTCNVTLRAPRHMKPPIFLYYELDNYYQNHRRQVLQFIAHQLSTHLSIAHNAADMSD